MFNPFPGVEKGRNVAISSLKIIYVLFQCIESKFFNKL